MTTVKEHFANYYRREFRRSDECLAAILNVLEWECPDSQKVADITDLLIKHYQRAVVTE